MCEGACYSYSIPPWCCFLPLRLMPTKIDWAKKLLVSCAFWENRQMSRGEKPPKSPIHPPSHNNSHIQCGQKLPLPLIFRSGFVWESGIKAARLCYGCRCSHKSSSGTQLLRGVRWYHPAFPRCYTSSLKRLLSGRCSIFHTNSTSMKLLMLLLKTARQIPISAHKWDQPEEIPLDGWPVLWFESNHAAAKCWHQLWCIA